MGNNIYVFIFYLILINLLAFILTVYDKKASKRGKNKKRKRIPEKYLLFVGVLGGSITMYITMKAIKHKTHHRRFMKGLPTILTFQFFTLMFALFFLIKI